MIKNNSDKKIIYILALCLLIMVITYYLGKELGHFAKQKELAPPPTERIPEPGGCSTT